MNIKINYLDNILPITEDKVTTLEIENKGCFYRTVMNFINISNGEQIEDIYVFDDKKEEINISNKTIVISDYFDLNLIVKKYSNHLQKYIIENTDESITNDLSIIYKKIMDKIKKSFESIDFSVQINDEFSLEQVIKLIKPTIQLKNDLLSNLYLLIDLEKIFKISKVMIFINLKQYINKNELLEFYKYCIYNNVKVLFIENKDYQVTLENEKKLIVDDNLDEIVL